MNYCIKVILGYVPSWSTLHDRLDLWFPVEVFYIIFRVDQKELLSCDEVVQEDDFFIMTFKCTIVLDVVIKVKNLCAKLILNLFESLTVALIFS